MKMMIIWLVLALAFGVFEAVTVQLVSIWFAAGAVAALGAYFFGASELVQLIVFVAVSAGTLILTRPFVKKYSKPGIKPTNADMMIGQSAVVTEKINNVFSSGAVKIKGIEWTARSQNDEEIPQGEIVTVEAIEGVKLIVSRRNTDS